MTFQDLMRIQGRNETKSLEYENYFRTRQTVRNTSLMAPPEYRVNYFTGITYCRLACQVISERIEIDAVRAKGKPDDPSVKAASDYLKAVLKSLGGSSFVNLAIMTAMEYGRSYLTPTGSDRRDGLPAVQIIPGRDMVHRVDPYTGEVIEALRVYGANRDKRVYYTADRTVYLVPNGEGRWQAERSVPNPNGRIAVFPLICRGEAGNSFGRPEAKDVYTLQDAACRIATDMAIASAAMAVPQRVLFGVEAEDFTRRRPDGTIETNADGTPKVPSANELYLSRLLTISEPAGKLAEFTAAQLQNFTTALNAITRQASAVLAVPQSVFGVASQANPESGDAMRQDDERLIRRAEQLTAGFESAWVDLFEYLLLTGGFGEVEVEILWVNPSLPNLAARADAVFKLAAVTVAGRPLYTWEEFRRLLGSTLEEIDAAKAEMETNEIMDLILQSPRTDSRGPIGVAA